MNNAFIAFYLIFLLSCFIAGVFIVYHITRYSINRKSSASMLLLFISVLTVLLIINLSIFINLDLEGMLNYSSSFDFNSSSF